MYRVYPTLLNEFERFKRGKATEADVLNMINHTEKPKTEWMYRGIAFHEFTSKAFPEIKSNKEGFYHYQFWDFPAFIVNEIRAIRAGGVHESYTERLFDTGNNTTMLFCFADTIKDSIIYDVKLTNWYRGITYLNSFQHKVSLYVIGSRMFRYLITDLKYIYEEDYNGDFSKSLATKVDELVEFMDHYKTAITYDKIFYKPSQESASKIGKGGRQNVHRGSSRGERKRRKT